MKINKDGNVVLDEPEDIRKLEALRKHLGSSRVVITRIYKCCEDHDSRFYHGKYNSIKGKVAIPPDVYRNFIEIYENEVKPKEATSQKQTAKASFRRLVSVFHS